jgi:hypothetical protein
MKCDMGGSSRIAFMALYPTQINGCVGMAAHVAFAKQYRDPAMTRDVSSHLVKDGSL